MSKAANTRADILEKAFGLIYKNGYQATSIDDILATTKVTKGAFYYHFKNKDEMGLAVINEFMYARMLDPFMKPLQQTADPLTEIYEMMKGLLMQNPFFDIRYGCPAVNLVEEMAPLQPDFNKALSKIITEWMHELVKSLERGKKDGVVNINVNPKAVGYFIAAGYSGVRNIGKIYGETAYKTYLSELKNYLESMR